MSNPNQGAATRARNIEIERRLTAGESGPALAKEFGITQPRVHQIARAVREARGDLAPAAKPGVRIRPRLRKVELGLWLCAGGGVAWSIGELPTLILAVTVAIQWSRSDDRAQKRADRHADRTGAARGLPRGSQAVPRAAPDRGTAHGGPGTRRPGPPRA